MTQKICHDCGCKEGELHQPGCDMERCPFCGGQLISCGCDDDYFTKKAATKFAKMLEEAGRIPYIHYPSVCMRCGSTKPKMFTVSDEEWEHYIEPQMRSKVLYLPCYTEIKRLIDKETK